MTMLFEPLDSNYEERADLHRAARLATLHESLAKRLERIERAADEVERAAALLVDVTHGSAVDAFQDAVRSNSSAAFLHLDAGQTLGM
ncbi:hypothetical protein C7I87_03000 [Mesorhizobium sp. SARCC-RB16n]|uniref:hypothetical protein n=1 Tax=Mesorhizobium sp. SARCC-RB16n TaxID=2116687 RepID=UPI00122F98BA|nr:hypothetical protein [Mesorhizobium sp. SARCC-RB16n]KAA3452164.1 hypothetical protein C7I87_03000 [Mesorhizobium sp. SARCC-RB16n]